MTWDARKLLECITALRDVLEARDARIAEMENGEAGYLQFAKDMGEVTQELGQRIARIEAERDALAERLRRVEEASGG